MTVSVEPDERAVLLRWKKRMDSFALVRMKAEAILYASEDVPSEVIGRMVERSKRTVQGWLRDWNVWRLGSVVTGHAGNENASKLTLTQKGEVAELLAAPPSDSGVPVAFWDVPALTEVVASRFGVEYDSASLRLIQRVYRMTRPRHVDMKSGPFAARIGLADSSLKQMDRLTCIIPLAFLAPMSRSCAPRSGAKSSTRRRPGLPS